MSGVRVASLFFASLWQPKHGLARIRPPGTEQAAGLSVRERANKCFLHLCLALFGVLSGVVVAAVVDDDHNTPELASVTRLCLGPLTSVGSRRIEKSRLGSWVEFANQIANQLCNTIRH